MGGHIRDNANNNSYHLLSVHLLIRSKCFTCILLQQLSEVVAIIISILSTRTLRNRKV